MLEVFIISNRKSIDARMIMHKLVIAKKLVIKDEDLVFMILELHNSVVSCFGIKMITQNMALF